MIRLPSRKLIAAKAATGAALLGMLSGCIDGQMKWVSAPGAGSNGSTLTTNPAAATSLGWDGSTLRNNTSVLAAWTPVADATLASQSVQFYGDSSCTSTLGAASLLGPTQSSSALPAGFTSGYLTYKVTSINSSGVHIPSECSSVLEVDITAPTAVSSLRWSETSPRASSSVTASWIKSASTDLANQQIQYYSDSSCTTASGSMVNLSSDTAQSHSWSAPGSGTYSYMVTSVDAAGNTSVSTCSSTMVVDLTPPNAATSLVWTGMNPSASTSVTVSWTKSGSLDLASQAIQFYSDTSCSTASGAEMVLASGVSTYLWTAPGTGTYVYKIKSLDTAGNTTVSTCSTSTVIDIDAPNAATALGWVQTSPSSTGSVNSSWTKSTSSDLSSQKIQIFDTTCSTAVTSQFTISSTVNTHSWSLPDGTYTYKVTSLDGAGNSTVSSCSSAIVIDTTAPSAATALGWVEATPRKLRSVTASWTRSGATDLSNQKIQFYTNNTCTTTTGSIIDLSSSSAQTYSWTTPSAGTFAYKLTSIDTAGNSTVSSCSSAMLVDETAPSNATSLGWSEASPHSTTAITASWTKSASADLANQKIQYYADGSCGTISGSLMDLSSGTTNTHAWNAPGSGTYSYKVTSIDTAGNSAITGCSSAMVINTTSPANATSLGWSETSPHTSLSITAAWTKSTDATLQSQSIQFYADGTCTTASGSPVTLGVADQTSSWAAPGDGNYSYRITSTNTASLNSTSSCSSAMVVDTSAPAASTTLSWSEATPRNNTAVTATWVRSASLDLANQKIQFFSDGSCTTTSGSLIDLGSATTQSRSFTAPTDGTYTFRVTSLDSAGLSTASGCSSAMVIDRVAPTTATSLGWTGANPSNSSSITASWSKSSSPDLASQKIQFYTASTCSLLSVSGAEIDLNSSTATSYLWSAPGAGTYYYRVTSIDTAGNSTSSSCSTASMVIDLTPPANATTLGWSQTSPQASTSITASWTKSTSNDLSTQKIQFYSDGSCTTANGSEITVGTANTYAWNSSTAGTYTYKIISVDGAGWTSTSTCSAVMTVDLTPPAAATTLVWMEASPRKLTTATASWSKSSSGDLSNQKIQLFTNNTCTTTAGSLIDLNSNTTTSYAFSSLAQGTYYYKLTSFDSAGNSTDSACSAAMVIDLTAPLNATSLAWSGANPSSTRNITATWTKSYSGDLANQKIQFYSGSSCNTASGSLIDLSSSTTQTYNWTAPADGDFSFRVTSVDSATWTSTTSCSSSIAVDTVMPTLTIAAPSPNYINGANYTNFSLQGTCSETGRDVNVQITSVTTPATTPISLTRTCNINAWIFSAQNLSSMPDGTVRFTATHSDPAGNTVTTSLDLTKDIVAPSASGLNASASGLTITANWTKSTSGDLSSQNIQYFSGSGCSTSVTSPRSVGNAATDSWTASGNGSYSYSVTSTDTYGNSAFACLATAVTVSGVATTLAATALYWNEVPPHSSRTITARWTPATDPAVTNQVITFHPGTGCSTAAISTHNILDNSTAAYNLTGNNGSEYSFKVISRNGSNATTGSTCSSVMTIRALNIEVPIEMADQGLIMTSGTSPMDFGSTQTYLNYPAYDGTVNDTMSSDHSFWFEVVATNTLSNYGTGVTGSVALVSGDGVTTYVTKEIAGNTSLITRYRVPFPAAESNSVYKVRLSRSGPTNAGSLSVNTARIVIRQKGATKTRIYIPLVSNIHSQTKATDIPIIKSTGITRSSGVSYELDPSNGAVWRYGDHFLASWEYVEPVAASYDMTLEAVLSTGNQSNLYLVNTTTGNVVGEAEESHAMVGTNLSTPTIKTITFPKTRSEFTIGHRFGLNIGGSNTAYLYRAGLWLNLTGVNSAKTYTRVMKSRIEAVAPESHPQQLALHPEFGTSDQRTGHSFEVCHHLSSGTGKARINLIGLGSDDANTKTTPGTSISSFARSHTDSTYSGQDRRCERSSVPLDPGTRYGTRLTYDSGTPPYSITHGFLITDYSIDP